MATTAANSMVGDDQEQNSGETVITFVSLGSNLGDPDGQLRRAIFELAELTDSRLLACSSFFVSKPLGGPPEQPEYLNAVAMIETGLCADALLRELQHIENAHGRERTLHWGARTLDLDILLYGNDIISTESLKVPHPEMQKRNFVLYPLLELVPDLEIPGVGWLRDLLQRCSAEGLRKYEPV
jgi:2-amino-4-hydroxy-6-hydroxymethyldihydropteridine diphosphokinase